MTDNDTDIQDMLAAIYWYEPCTPSRVSWLKALRKYYVSGMSDYDTLEQVKEYLNTLTYTELENITDALEVAHQEVMYDAELNFCCICRKYLSDKEDVTV